LGEDLDVEKAVEAFKDGESTKIAIALFKDKAITVCTKEGGDKHTCYHIEGRPENEKLYYIIQSWFADLKFKIRKLTED
jgi:hypothetical protein